MDPLKTYVGHVTRWWPRADIKLKFDNDPPDVAWKIVIADTSDEAGALGYHDFTPDGRPISYVFAKDDENYGYSVTVTLTHELAEMIADPWISQVFQVTNTQFYAQEICDPCEADELGYEIGGIQVSDFVTPRWFIPGSTGSVIFDHAKKIGEPLQILPGGYMSVFDTTRGGWGAIHARREENDVIWMNDAKMEKNAIESTDNGDRLLQYSRLTRYGRDRG